MLKKVKRLFGLLLVSCSFLFSLCSCNILGGVEEGLMISGISANNLPNGDTELTITFTDEDADPVTLLIPKGKEGNKGETGKPGTGISSIVEEPSKDGSSTKITIKYTDKSIEPTSFVVKHGVSVVDITSIPNVSNNSTKITFKLSDGTKKDVEVPNGKDGIGVDSVTSAPDGEGNYIITITYTGDRAPSQITIPRKNGEDGVGIENIVGTQVGSEYIITITYTDNAPQKKQEFSIPLPKTTKWMYGNGAPRASHARRAIDGDYYFDLENAVIYIFTQNTFNEVINLKQDHTPSETYKVTFNAGEGTFASNIPVSITVTAGRPIDSTRIPTVTAPEGKKFIGFYTTPEGPDNPLSGKLTDLTPIYRDMDLYAIYR